MSPKNVAALRIFFVLIWSGFVVAAYYVVQKPLALQIIDQLSLTVWTLVVTSILLLNALALGTWTIRQVVGEGNRITTLLLAGGLGLGVLGLFGFILAALGVARFEILLGIQIFFLIWFVYQGMMADVLAGIGECMSQIRESASHVPGWMRWMCLLGLGFTFLLTLLPPVEAFDALLYHLTVPYLWLQDGGVRAYDMPPYWFPGIVEGAFVWGLGLGTDIVPQQLHFLWGVSIGLLLWHWSCNLWDDHTAWWVLMLLVSMPSLPLLASWAYTDLALSFFALSTLYTLWQGHHTGNTNWWRLAAIFAGLAMGVKYTSAIIPVTAVLLISVWMFREQRKWLIEVTWFCA
ncbi:MAG TPA: glycosyltransferase family 39 protein, partial [Anaerolineales bacterium]|nr:glycosyltransferase family 39 protein [Anaerolineales bacterium]